MTHVKQGVYATKQDVRDLPDALASLMYGSVWRSAFVETSDQKEFWLCFCI